MNMMVMSLIFILLIVGYVAPWLNMVMPLALGAYDLAEWVSLYSGYPVLAPALFIRLQLVFILYYVVVMIRIANYRHITWVIPALLIIAQLPPLELFLGTSDFNQIQQLLLTLFSVLLVFVVSKAVGRYSLLRISLLFISLLAIISSIVGLGMSMRVLNLFGTYPTIGWGIVIYIFAWFVLAGTIVMRTKEAG